MQGQSTSSTSQAIFCQPREQGINPLLCLIQPWQDSTSTYVTTGQFHGLEEIFPPTGLSVGLRKGEDDVRQTFMNSWWMMNHSHIRRLQWKPTSSHTITCKTFWGLLRNVRRWVTYGSKGGKWQESPTISYGCKSVTLPPRCRDFHNVPLAYYGLASPFLLHQVKPCFIHKHVFIGCFHGIQFTHCSYIKIAEVRWGVYVLYFTVNNQHGMCPCECARAFTSWSLWPLDLFELLFMLASCARCHKASICWHYWYIFLNNFLLSFM